MKKWLTVFAVVTLVVAWAYGNAFSMGQAPKSTEIKGKVDEVQLRALMVKITPKTGNSVLLLVNDNTKLTKGGKNIILPAIKKNDQVTVTYRTSWRKKIALAIDVHEPVVATKKAVPAVAPKQATPAKSKK